ncbi:transport and Golgi organization protein 1 homolog isoform X1 [Neovison vison]|uniref:transport and Golgi organization protein 1 homolog isoform X1 n=2 Tax=Neovison vison TaxID=452646 RepID=UPI001CF0688C|nr:transport and Golgi organization protein 1 homolog isoform X1 [Neogale vison]
MEKYRQEVEEMREELQESNLTFNHKIAVQERNALANWMKAQYWETRMMQQSRENAYLKYRLCMMKGEMLPVGSMRREPMPGRPELQKPVWQGREHDVKCSSSLISAVPVGDRCVSCRESQACRLSEGVIGGCIPYMPPGSRTLAPMTGGAHATPHLPPATPFGRAEPEKVGGERPSHLDSVV